jgi:hypothetical protein
MVERTFAITLDGTVSLDRWTGVLSAWNKSLDLLAKDLGPRHLLSMRIAGLTFGSAITEVAADFDDPQIADAFTREHDRFSRALRDGNIIDFPPPLQRSGKQLLKAAKLDSADEIIMSSDSGDVVIGLASSSTMVTMVAPVATGSDAVTAHGGVVGVLQSISSRGSLRAVVFDEINDKAVRCLISPEQHDEVGALWDQLVEVRGLVSRDPHTGRPLSVREVKSIRGVEKHFGEADENAWLRARGVLKNAYPGLSSVDLIRMVRDE